MIPTFPRIAVALSLCCLAGLAGSQTAAAAPAEPAPPTPPTMAHMPVASQVGIPAPQLLTAAPVGSATDSSLIRPNKCMVLAEPFFLAI